jgi:DNA-binding response OmpR family regulator
MDNKKQTIIRTKALLIDDDVQLGEMLKSYLARHQIDLSMAHDGETGIIQLKSKAFDIVLLDIMLPGIDGMEVCRQIRAFSNIPIIMLTARGEITDRIVGLELGSDDYVSKPFDSRELVARINVLIRRTKAGIDQKDQVLRIDDLEIDPGSRKVKKAGNICDLTGFQFDLLYYMAKRAGRVLTRDELLESVRGRELEAFDRSIDVHISRIRAAIKDNPHSPHYLITVRGIGYMFSKEYSDEN